MIDEFTFKETANPHTKLSNKYTETYKFDKRF